MIDDMLEAGTLVAPFGGKSGESGACYWLAWSKDAKPTAAAQKIARWIENTATRAVAAGDSAAAPAKLVRRRRMR